METRRNLYKPTFSSLTMTERVKKGKDRQNEKRNDRFNANRKIDIDDTCTPEKPAPKVLSKIKNKSEKLKAYIEQKRTTKLKEKVEQRSPFIPYVPVGRWVERKEPVRKPKAFTISTPIKNALMSDGKIFKKSTIKEIATTARKENATVVKKGKKVDPVKSRKKILTEFNNVPKDQEKLTLPEQKLDDTFEINPIQESQQVNLINDDSVIEVLSPEKSPSPIREIAENGNVENTKELPIVVTPVKKPSPSPIHENAKNSELAGNGNAENSKELPIVVTPVKKSSAVVEKKIKEQVVKVPSQLNANKKEAKKQTAQIVVPVKHQTREKKPAKAAESKPTRETKKKNLPKTKSTQEEMPIIPISPEKVQEEVIVKAVPKKVHSSTYNFYKSSLNNQVAFISIQLKALNSNIDSFIQKLPEDAQANIHQTIQQGNLLINDKMKKFGDLLEDFENSSEPKNITDDDIENYWMILFDQVEEFKVNLKAAQESKIIATKDDNKRRTRKTIIETPTRRSRRIAETGDTPRHNPSCFGCTPLSSSKVNTPKSAKVRRTAFKKSIAFEEA